MDRLRAARLVRQRRRPARTGAAAGIAASLGARHAAGAFGAREPGLGL